MTLNNTTPEEFAITRSERPEHRAVDGRLGPCAACRQGEHLRCFKAFCWRCGDEHHPYRSGEGWPS